MASLKHSYWKNVLIQASGNSAAQIVGILGMPLLTRLYSPEAFGMLGIFIQATTLCAAFVTFRFEYFVPLLKDHHEYVSFAAWVFKTGCFMAFVLSGTFYLLYLAGCWSLIGVELGGLIALAPIVALAICVGFLVQHESQRREDFKISALSELASKVGYVLFALMLSPFTKVLGLLLATAGGTFLKIVVLSKFLFNVLDEEYKESTKELVHRFRSRAVGMVISNTLMATSMALPIFFIGRLYGAEELGHFFLVTTTIFLPSALVGTAIGSVFYQKSAQLVNDREYENVIELWKNTLFKLVVFAIPVYFLMFSVSKWAYPLIFGREWAQAGLVATIYTLAAFFSFLAGPLDRLSLILGVAVYLPLVHLLRLAVILAVMGVAVLVDADFMKFIFLLSVATSFVYLLDILLGRVLLGYKARESTFKS